ncbi:hypothetical protein [Saccharothrix syringae]|uniref:Uncharacterized protein n=1 Tax=Saccharothrix syringae TaxID=103733 RepID=A0A5Q0H9L3_SACSY|nr:hypothetical protein [Saccharothrix syringae]QFZ22928.1 hypothetical protein EKG83_40775 [Saccharothrix syringae]
MSYYDDDEDDRYSGPTYNDASGWSHNSIQARNIYDGVHYYAPDTGDGPIVYFRPGAIVVLVGVLYIIASAYAHAILNLDLTVWEWAKLAVSSLLVIPVFYATERTFHLDVFVALRLFITLAIIVLAFLHGTDWALTQGLASFIGDWLVWRF